LEERYLRKRITIKDIAREAGVSIATVSNVINKRGRVSPETSEAIWKIIQKRNYSPSMAARSLKAKRSHLIALVVPFLPKGKIQENPFFWQLLAGIEAGARNQQFHVIFTGLDNSSDLSFAVDWHLDGLIVLGTYEGSPVVDEIDKLKIPCVFVDSYLEDEKRYQICLDDYMGGYLGTKHLIGLGHRKIMLLADTLDRKGVNYHRWLGYKKALEESDIPYDPNLVCLDYSVNMMGGYYLAQKAFQKINAADPLTAIFALSDVAAIGLIKGLCELGVSVPGDVSVMGFDDIQYAKFMVPSLTTISQDIFKKGQAAVSLLLDQIHNKDAAGERRIVLPVELKVRQSTRPVR